MAKVMRPYSIRIPESVYRDISEMAENDYRSFNSEIIVLLVKALEVMKSNKCSVEK
ncbi:Arc family DNA-binding protein [Alicyclobacillaceae bacterium I2511]|nr:Arc family DNA-binding protein [Alicyclobacillaceae bacterium I2511]